MEEELSIKDLAIALWRKKLLIVITTLVFFLIGVILYGRENNNNSEIIIVNNKDIVYVQTDFILGRGISEVVDGVTNTYKLTLDGGIINNLNTFSKSNNFLESVLKEIGSKEKVENIQSNINIFGNSSDIITLVVALENKEEAIKITNKILENLKEKVNYLYQISELTIIDGPKEISEKSAQELENTTISEPINANIAPQEKNESSPKKKIILMTIVGFIISCGIVVVAEIFSSSVKNEDSLEKATNSKVLVKVPKTELDLTDKFELLRVKLSDYKTILVTSPENKTGKSFIALNLAKSYAKFGKKVLLIDIKTFSENKEIGKKKSEFKNLTIELSEENNFNEVKLSDSEIKEKIEKLEKIYEIIIIDSNTVLESANTLSISKFAKTIIVSSERKTKIENIVKAKNNIEDIGGNVIGNVLNKVAKK